MSNRGMRKDWTLKEINLIKRMYKGGFSYKEIAKKIGDVTANAIGMRIRKLSKQGQIKTRKWICYNRHNFDKINKEDLIKGILIWWCEGTKPSKHNTAVEFVNSDPILSWYFVNFLRKLNINEKKIKLRLKIDQKSELKVKKFWCRILELPMSSFNKSLPFSGQGKRKGRLKYGTLTIKYCSKALLLELTGILKELMEKNLPAYLENHKYRIEGG